MILLMICAETSGKLPSSTYIHTEIVGEEIRRKIEEEEEERRERRRGATNNGKKCRGQSAH